MCLIFVSQDPQSWKITNERLENAKKGNPHGCGLAFWDKCRWKATLNPSTEQIQTIAKSAPVIVHYRFATHGEQSASNTQPFRLNEQNVFAHNGIVTGTWSGVKNTDSDSKRIARILAQTPKDCWGEILNMLADGHSSRFVLGTSGGKARFFGQGWGADTVSPTTMCSDGGKPWAQYRYDPKSYIYDDDINTPQESNIPADAVWVRAFCEVCDKKKQVTWSEELGLDICKDCNEFYSPTRR